MHLIVYIGIILYMHLILRKILKNNNKKKDLMLYLLIKWYFRKASYILRIFIRFQIKTNIKVVIFLDIKIA